MKQITIAAVLLVAFSPTQINADLIGFYAFDDPANPLKDASSKGNNLTSVEVDPVYVEDEGFEGGAYEFDGKQRLISPVNLNPSVHSKVTFGAWVKTATLEEGLYKVIGHDNGGWDRTIGLDSRVQGGDPDFRYTAFTGVGGPIEGTSWPESTDDWTFIAVSYNQEEQLASFYVDVDANSTDDELEEFESDAFFGEGFPTVAIGGIRPDRVAEGWIGMIDNVFFYDELLDYEQLTLIRDGGKEAILKPFPKPEPFENLIGFYSFDDKSSPLKDSSGISGALKSSGSDPVFESEGGVKGGGYLFDGTQRLLAPINADPEATPRLTFGAWVKASTLEPGLRKVLGSDDGGWDRTIGLDNRNPDEFRYTAFVGNGPPVTGGPAPNSTDKWSFLAATYDQPNKSLSLYVDLDSSTIEDAPIIVRGITGMGPTRFAQVAVGGIRPDNANEGWKGYIDNVFFYDEILSDGQIVNIRDGGMNEILSGEEPNLKYPKYDSLLGHLQQNPGIIEVLIPISNTAQDETLEIEFVEPIGPAAGKYEVVDFPMELAPGKAGKIKVSFDPGSKVGLFEAMLEIVTNDPGDPVVNVDLSAVVPTGRNGLIAFYPFDNESNPTKDTSENQHDLKSRGADPTYDLSGFEGGALSFDGRQRFEIPINISPTAKPELTIGAWVRSSTIDAGQRKVIGHDNGGWDRTIGLDSRQPDELRYTSFVGNGPPVADTPGPENIDQWAFIAAVYDQSNNKVTVYVDTDAKTIGDSPVAVASATGFGPGHATASLGSVRPDNPNEGWIGQIDNVFVFDRLLPPEEIAEIRDGGFESIVPPQPIPLDALIGFYPFDDPENPLADVSGAEAELESVDADPSFEADGGFTGGGFLFDGTQRLVAPLDINPDQIPELTMGAWVKTSTLSPGLRKVMGHDNGGWDRTIGLDNRNGDFRYTSFIGNGRPVLGTPGPENIDNWTFMAAVYDQSSNQVTVYVDIDAATIGDSLASVTEPTDFGQGHATVSIGSLRPDNPAEGWQGYIDNAFFFAAALSADQITQIRNGRSPVPVEGDDPSLVVLATPEFDSITSGQKIIEGAITIRNDSSTQTLKIKAAELMGPDAAYFKVDYPENVSPGEKANIKVIFDTKGQVGVFKTVLLLVSNDPSQPKTNLDLSAEIKPGESEDPILIAGPSAFGNLGPKPGKITKDIDISNDGESEVLIVASVILEGKDASHYTINSYPTEIGPGKTAQVEIAFNPADKEGLFSASLAIISNDARGRRQAIDLSAEIPFSNTSKALIAFYPFDSDEDRLEDASGNSNTLKEIEGFEPFYVEDINAEEDRESGAMEFFDNRLIAPININPSEFPQLTMGAWVQTFNLDPGQRKIIGSDNGGWDRTIGLDARNPAELRYTSFVGNGPPVAGTPAPDDSEAWTFIAAAYDQSKGEVTVYADLDADGTDYDLEVVTGKGLFGPGFPTVSIGSLRPDNQNESWDGLIDNVFFFSTVLTPNQMEAIRDGGANSIIDGVEIKTEPFLIVPQGKIIGETTAAELPLTVDVEITNRANTQDLKISSTKVVGVDSDLYSIVSAPKSLGPNETGAVKVLFDSESLRGGFTAALEIESNDAQWPLKTVDLSVFVGFSNPKEALIGFYPFDDEENPYVDASGRGNDLEIVEGAEPIHEPEGGIDGGAFDFDGTTRLVAPIDINPDVLSQMTMGAWVKTHNLNPGLRKVMGHDNGGWDRTIGLDNRNGDFRYTSFIGNGRPVLGTPGPENIDNWTFLASVYDQEVKEVTVYVDIDASTTDDDLVVVTEPASFGLGQNTLSIGSLRPDNGSEGWVGLIDNAFVYQTKLTLRQLMTLRNGGAIAILGEVPVPLDPPALEIMRNTDGTVTVTFEGTLQVAPSAIGPWKDMVGESSITLEPNEEMQFGRAVRN